MLKVVFKGETHGHSRYEELAECWMAALMRKKEAVHVLALAQRDIKNLENGFSKVIGPELVHYYRGAFYQGEDTSTALGRYMEMVSHVLMQPNAPGDGPISTLSAL